MQTIPFHIHVPPGAGVDPPPRPAPYHQARGREQYEASLRTINGRRYSPRSRCPCGSGKRLKSCCLRRNPNGNLLGMFRVTDRVTHC